MEETVKIPKKIFDALVYMVNDTPNRRLDYPGFKHSYELASALDKLKKKLEKE